MLRLSIPMNRSPRWSMTSVCRTDDVGGSVAPSPTGRLPRSSDSRERADDATFIADLSGTLRDWTPLARRLGKRSAHCRLCEIHANPAIGLGIAGKSTPGGPRTDGHFLETGRTGQELISFSSD